MHLLVLGVAAAAIQYPEGQRHSPITEEVAANLAAIAAYGPDQDDRMVAKVGDSITESASFLRCFADDDVGFDGLDRASLAAVSGWAARGPITPHGDGTTPLDAELAEIAPRYAVVMFGTNDVGYRGHDLFGADLWTIVDTLITRGIIPVLSTIPPIDSDDEANARIPTFNRIVRAIAQGRRIPLVDYHRELSALPDHGLIKDGIHPTTSPLGACELGDAGLASGYNLRNLITLEALERARGVIEGGKAPDRRAPLRTGSGTHRDPFEAALPFADLADTRAGDDAIDRYDGCDASKPEGGREIVYRLELDRRVTLDAYVVDRGDTDVDVHILGDSLAGGACLARGDKAASAEVGPGTVHVVVDSFVDDDGVAREGEFVLVMETGESGSAP